MQLNLKSLIFLILIAGLILTGCGAPAAATVAPATAAPATAAPATEAPVLRSLRPPRSPLNCGPTTVIRPRCGLCKNCR